jgi:hypothetical protein
MEKLCEMTEITSGIDAAVGLGVSGSDSGRVTVSGCDPAMDGFEKSIECLLNVAVRVLV